MNETPLNKNHLFSIETSTCFGLRTNDTNNIEEIRIVYQNINGNQLEVLTFLPGIKRQTLHVRIKNDVLAISAEYKDELKKILKPCRPIEIRVSLIKKVDSKTTRATYIDGVLKIQTQLLQS